MGDLIVLLVLSTVLMRGVVTSARRSLGLLLAGFATNLVGHVWLAGRQILSRRENHRMVVTDPLTGLANRVLFRDRLTRALQRRRTDGGPAVLLVDLDGFKDINDNHGHETGDDVLVSFAALLSQSVRRSDCAARLGGDEFAVLVEGITESQAAIDVARRLLSLTHAHPVRLTDGERPIGCSIGIAVHDPRDARPDGGEPDAAMLLNRADQAMYLAKRSVTTRWALYDQRVAGATIPPPRRRSDRSDPDRAHVAPQ